MLDDLRSIGRRRRQTRVRRRVRGTDTRPRLCVFRSEHHTYAQVISDVESHTLAAASTLERELRSVLRRTATVEAAREVGKLIAKRCQAQGITRVLFDRNGFLCHGRVKAVADGAREGGLEF